MRRRPAFPKAGDRVRLQVPHPSGGGSPVRRGTVVERSCGGSSALRIRWDADGGRPPGESWLADAGWHWSHGHLRVLAPGSGPELGAGARPAVAPAAADEPWLPSPRTVGARAPMAPAATAGAASAEWEAALAAERAPAADDSWKSVLAGALGLAHGTGAAVDHPPAPPKVPDTPVRLTPPPAPPPAVAPPAPAPLTPPPTPAPPAAPPAAPAARRADPSPGRPPGARNGDDILPHRGVRKGRRRG
ncbi:MAG: hypothetical protein ACLGIO_08740 [Acidimicrobiia bacterium]